MTDKDLAAERQREINRILKAYRKDKKLGLLIIGVLVLSNFLTIAFGKEGLKMLMDFIKDIFT